MSRGDEKKDRRCGEYPHSRASVCTKRTVLRSSRTSEASERSEANFAKLPFCVNALRAHGRRGSAPRRRRAAASGRAARQGRAATVARAKPARAFPYLDTIETACARRALRKWLCGAVFWGFSLWAMSEDFRKLVDTIGDLEVHKRAALGMANVGKLSGCVSDAQYARLLACGSYVGLQYDDAQRLRVTEACFCRARMCPMCAWRKSLRTFVAMQDMVAAMPGYDYILCTVTVPNVGGSALGDEITRMYRRWRDMVRLPELRAWCGWLRSTEVTYSPARGDYHPHIHALVAVKTTYWKSRAYVSQATAQRLWGLGIVDLRRVRDIGRGVAEVAKYAVKPLDVKVSDAEEASEVYRTLHNALHGRRLTQTSGCIRETLRALRVDIEADDTRSVTDEGAPLLALSWDGNRYVANRATRGFAVAGLLESSNQSTQMQTAAESPGNDQSAAARRRSDGGRERG